MIHYWSEAKPVRHFLTDPRMPIRVLDSHARCVTRGLPEEYELIGEDDALPVQFVIRVTREYVEATTNHRFQPNGLSRLVCPVCNQMDGKHAKGCLA